MGFGLMCYNATTTALRCNTDINIVNGVNNVKYDIYCYSEDLAIYFSNADLCWLITSFGLYHAINLTIIKLFLERDYDFLKIYDGECRSYWYIHPAFDAAQRIQQVLISSSWKKKSGTAEPRFTNIFFVVIQLQLRWKFWFTVTLFLVMISISLRYFAHATKANLSCHLPNLIAITFIN